MKCATLLLAALSPLVTTAQSSAATAPKPPPLSLAGCWTLTAASGQRDTITSPRGGSPTEDLLPLTNPLPATLTIRFERKTSAPGPNPDDPLAISILADPPTLPGGPLLSDFYTGKALKEVDAGKPVATPDMVFHAHVVQLQPQATQTTPDDVGDHRSPIIFSMCAFGLSTINFSRFARLNPQGFVGVANARDDLHDPGGWTIVGTWVDTRGGMNARDIVCGTQKICQGLDPQAVDGELKTPAVTARVQNHPVILQVNSGRFTLASTKCP